MNTLPDDPRFRKPTLKEQIVEVACGVAFIGIVAVFMVAVAIDWLFRGERDK
jgi:hypothetical protein